MSEEEDNWHPLNPEFKNRQKLPRLPENVLQEVRREELARLQEIKQQELARAEAALVKPTIPLQTKKPWLFGLRRIFGRRRK